MTPQTAKRPMFIWKRVLFPIDNSPQSWSAVETISVFLKIRILAKKSFFDMGPHLCQRGVCSPWRWLRLGVELVQIALFVTPVFVCFRPVLSVFARSPSQVRTLIVFPQGPHHQSIKDDFLLVSLLQFLTLTKL